MIDVHITFENAAQIRHFRKKLIHDFRCSATRCAQCKDVVPCEMLARFLEDLGVAELKYSGKEKK